MWRAEVIPPEFAGGYLDIMLTALVGMNELYLRRFRKTPGIYAAGVVYRREPQGLDKWVTIPHVMARGFGDCEDLASWRAAELRRLGEDARAVSRHVKTNPDGSKLFHIVVRRGDGRIEDPSRRLGMGRT